MTRLRSSTRFHVIPSRRAPALAPQIESRKPLALPTFPSEPHLLPTATLDVSSRGANGGIELKPIRPATGNILDIYDQLRQQEKDKVAKEKLSRVFGEDENADMKFSHSIQFNAVPDWSSNYIAYSNLKKLIYSLEKQVNQRQQTLATDAEVSPLLETAGGDPDQAFTQALDHELEKIEAFYPTKEAELFQEVEALILEKADLAENAELAESSRKRRYSGSRRDSVFKDLRGPGRRRSSITQPMMERIDSDDSDDEPDERSTLRRPATRDSDLDASRELSSPKLLRRSTSGLEDGSEAQLADSSTSAERAKKRIGSLYVSLCELKSYVQLNRTGFSKVLKKYDKTLDKKLKSSYLSNKVSQSFTFKQETTDNINERISQVEQLHADIYNASNIEEAKRELRLDLREHVVWERNTVWREMIGIERKAQAANLGVRQAILGGRSEQRRQGDEETQRTKEIVTPVGRYRCPAWLFSGAIFTLIISIAVFALLLSLRFMQLPEQQNCLALVVFVSILWATEAIPLFVTSLLIPFLVVVLRVVRTDAAPHDRLQSKAAASYIFGAMWTPVIMLLLGGFTIAAALSKHNIAKVLATFVLSKAGTRPRNVLLTSMFVSMFSSMWISNVASPVLCYSILQPILRNLPNDSNMIKALLLGVALSANIGGAASPIASPQNLIALQNMEPEPGWGVWFFISLPVCILSILLIWVLLLLIFQPGRGVTIVPIRPMRDRFTGVQWFITAVTLGTIGLWCVTHQLEPIFGDMGVVAIIPIVLFFGTGVLTKEDFNNFLWTIIILAAGGLALGKAVSSSGLLETIAAGITARVENFSLYGVLVVFAAMIVVIASFISHTVAALIILPLVREVGAGMAEPHPNLLVMGSVLMCSAAMALPTSGFPNMTAIMMENPQTGQRYLQVKHFIMSGVPASLLTFAVVVTLGYGLMRAVGL